MEELIPYAVWAAIILVGLGVVTMVLFGLRSLAYGKISWMSILIVVIPIVLLVILGLAMETWSEAAIMTTLIMLGLGVLGLFISGVRGVSGF